MLFWLGAGMNMSVSLVNGIVNSALFQSGSCHQSYYY